MVIDRESAEKYKKLNEVMHEEEYKTSDQLEAKIERNHALIGTAVSAVITGVFYYLNKNSNPDSQNNLYILPAIVFGTASALCAVGVIFSHFKYKHDDSKN